MIQDIHLPLFVVFFILPKAIFMVKLVGHSSNRRKDFNSKVAVTFTLVFEKDSDMNRTLREIIQTDRLQFPASKLARLRRQGILCSQ